MVEGCVGCQGGGGLERRGRHLNSFNFMNCFLCLLSVYGVGSQHNRPKNVIMLLFCTRAHYL